MASRLRHAEADLVREIRARWFTPSDKLRRRSALWKDALREHVGADGEVLWRGLLSIAEGQAWIPRMADGREGPPQVPTTSDRFLAYRFLAEALFGKAPTQEKIAEAERAAAENTDLRAMSDADLEAEVKKQLLARVTTQSEDADFVPKAKEQLSADVRTEDAETAPK